MTKTAKERYIGALNRESLEYTPIVPIIGHFAATFSGYSIKEYTLDPEIMAESLINTQKKLNYDAIYIASDTWVNAGAMGCEVEFFENQPASGKSILSTKSDIKKLKIPNPYTDGRWPIMLEAASKVVEEVGDKICIIGNIDQSPFSLAGELRGLEKLMMDLHEDPSFVFEILNICTEAVIAYGRAMADAGVHVLNTGDSIAQLIGPEMYQKFALPYEKKVFNNLKKKNDIPCTLHICGDTTKIIDLIPESQADGFEVDHAVDIQKAYEHIGSKITLIGNIDPVDVLYNKSPDQIKNITIEYLKDFKDKKGFILASGCAISPDNPAENIQAMVEARQKYKL